MDFGNGIKSRCNRTCRCRCRRCRRCRRDTHVGHQQGCRKLRCSGDQRAGGVHDHGVTVEDEFVLPTDDVHVGEGAGGLPCTCLAQGKSDVILLAFVG